MDNHKISFAMKKSKSDEWYTPEIAVLPVVKYLKPKSKIWCPFDINESNFVKVLAKYDFDVINTHIKNGQDFFETDIECDYIISNPPYSYRNNVLSKLFKLKIPFMMLMNTNGLFDSNIRWELFKNNNFSLIYLRGRTSFFQEYGIKQTTSPPFQSAYICSGISDKQIIFDERESDEIKFDFA